MAGKVKLTLELTLTDWAELKRAVEDTQKALGDKATAESRKDSPKDHALIRSLKERYTSLEQVIKQL